MAAAICEHLADGLSLKEVCLLAGMPARRTVYKWLSEHPSFVLMYARAERADLIADEIVTIADSDPDPQRARNRIDARKWMAARLAMQGIGRTSGAIRSAPACVATGPSP